MAGTLVGVPAAGMVEDLRARFYRAGAEARIVTTSGERVRTAIRDAAASDADAVVVGGGDGTIATAAGFLLGTGKALGLLPLGTMNLLARDLGLPSDMASAVKVLVGGNTRLIDVAEVNGHIFLNNAVLGLYPSLVRARERQRGVPGARKWPAMAAAVYKSLYYYNLIEVEVDLDLGHGPQLIKTPALAVVNNIYRDRSSAFLERPALDEGQLGVYVAKHRTRVGLVGFMIGLVLGGWQQDAELECLTMTELSVTSRTRHGLRVSIDGEVVRLSGPLNFCIRPRALPVLVPQMPVL